jgi:DNA-directed RNA polymerase subunit beta'
MDRALAKTFARVAIKNAIIDSSILLKLKSSGIKVVPVRSPLTCETVEGICIKCYGMLPNGQPPSVGENVGVLEGQALTERSTQLTMQTFHSGGTALSGGGITGSFPRLKQLLEVPENLSGKAVLATEHGTVEKIEKNPIGGRDITVNGKVYTASSDQNVIVKPKHIVMKGQALTEGAVQPQELGKLTDHLSAQKYIVDQLNTIYGDEFHKKSFETVVRAVSDNAIVTNAPEDSGFYRGDKTTISAVDKMNKERSNEGLDKIKYSPYFKSIETANVDQNDWLTRFTTNRIKQALQEGVASGAYTDLHGKDPIPAYLYGDEFGKTQLGKKSFY